MTKTRWSGQLKKRTRYQYFETHDWINKYDWINTWLKPGATIEARTITVCTTSITRNKIKRRNQWYEAGSCCFLLLTERRHQRQDPNCEALTEKPFEWSSTKKRRYTNELARFTSIRFPTLILISHFFLLALSLRKPPRSITSTYWIKTYPPCSAPKKSSSWRGLTIQKRLLIVLRFVARALLIREKGNVSCFSISRSRLCIVSTLDIS